MDDVSISDLRESLADAVKAVISGDRIVISRHGKPVAALVPFEDLTLLRHIEDHQDHREARQAQADYDVHGGVDWQEIKKELEL